MSRHGRPAPTSRERVSCAVAMAVAVLAIVAWAEVAPGASFVSVAAPTIAADHKHDDDDDEGSPPPRRTPPPAPPTPEPAVSTPSAPAPARAEPVSAPSFADPQGVFAGPTAPAPMPPSESRREVAGVESAAPNGSPPPAAVSARVIEVSATGTASVMVACQGPVACRGTLVIEVPASAARARAAGSRLVAARRGRRLRIGKASFSVAPGSTGTVRVRMSRRGRKLLGRSGRIRATATIFSAGASTTFPITLRADRGGPAR